MAACDERPGRLKDESHLRRVGLCRRLTALRVDDLLAVRDARSAVEARYLDGHGTLFPDLAAAFEEQLSRCQEIAAMAVRLAEIDGVEPAGTDEPAAAKSPAVDLVHDLVEPAKSAALEKLGEGARALDVAPGWLRGKFASVSAD